MPPPFCRNIFTIKVVFSIDKSSYVADNTNTMTNIERNPEIMTPEQAAQYLQVNKETIYRYIRQGTLVASRLGRTYRIPKRSLDLLLWTTRTRKDLTLREYSGEEIAQFIRDDELDEEARQIAQRVSGASKSQSEKRRRQAAQ